MLKIARIGDKIVAILAFCTGEGWLPALQIGVKGSILPAWHQSVIGPPLSPSGGERKRGEGIREEKRCSGSMARGE